MRRPTRGIRRSDEGPAKQQVFKRAQVYLIGMGRIEGGNNERPKRHSCAFCLVTHRAGISLRLTLSNDIWGITSLGAVMALRKSIVTLAVVAALSAASVSQPKAAIVSHPVPPPATSMTLAAGGGLAVGIIATAALLCIYDVWLKINGYKNWDGSPKTQAPPSKHHR